MGGQVGACHNSNSEYSITFDGVINENYFLVEERETELINNLEISMAKVKNPITGKAEKFIGLFLKSKYDGTEGIREPVDLCITLDTSGSMSCNIENDGFDGENTRNNVSVSSIVKLISQLREEDGIAINKFDEESHSIIPFKLKRDLKEEDIAKIKKIKPTGSTNIYNALKGAMDQLTKSIKKNKRIVMITDLWAHDEDLKDFKELFKKCVRENHIEFTIIGISYDANASLAELVSYERGCNYYNVATEKDLNKYLVKDFNYILFPHSYDLKVKFGSGNSKITEIIGTGNSIVTEDKLKINANSIKSDFLKNKEQLKYMLLCLKRKNFKLPNTCCACIANYLKYNKLDVCDIGTAIPSELEFVDDKVYMEGGLILLKLTNQNELHINKDFEFDCEFTLEYDDREHKQHSKHFQIRNKKIENKDDDYFSNKSIENGMALYYYTYLCQKLLNYKNGYLRFDPKNPYQKNAQDEIKKLINENKKYHDEKILNDVKSFLKKHYQVLEGLPNNLEKYLEKIDNSFKLDSEKKYKGE